MVDVKVVWHYFQGQLAVQPPLVVYHVAAMGNWEQVVREQLRLLRDVELTSVRATHVGGGQEWLLEEARRIGVALTLVRSDPNTDHYETFAMLEVERLAKVEHTNTPILYLHTKGVSNPAHIGKALWRRTMEDYLVRRWRENLLHLTDGYDAVGVNWHQHGEQHFSGNFWLAHPDWIRRLPDYVGYHAAKQFVRYSCEMWIGAQQWCRAYSLACADHPMWVDDYDFSPLLPPPPPLPGKYLNLGSGQFRSRHWINVDIDPRTHPDVVEDAARLPSFGAGSVDAIFAGHVAEHFEDVEVAFARWFDVLRPGGVLTVVVPDGNSAADLWADRRHFPVVDLGPDEGFVAAAVGFARWAPGVATPPGRFQLHRRVFDRSSLRLCLRAVGFTEVREVDGHELMVAPSSRVGWQVALEARKPPGGTR